MRNQEWDSTFSQLHPLDLAQLVFCLFSRNVVYCEATFGVVDEAEVLASFFNGDHIHEASRVGYVGADFAIDLDKALHDNGFRLSRIEGILETRTR